MCGAAIVTPTCAIVAQCASHQTMLTKMMLAMPQMMLTKMTIHRHLQAPALYHPTQHGIYRALSGLARDPQQKSVGGLRQLDTFDAPLEFMQLIIAQPNAWTARLEKAREKAKGNYTPTELNRHRVVLHGLATNTPCRAQSRVWFLAMQ